MSFFRFGKGQPHGPRKTPSSSDGSPASRPARPTKPLAQPAAWEIRDPEDTRDPVPHTLHLAFDTDDGTLRVVGASIRGRLHAHRGMYREDHLAAVAVDGGVLFAVSDGAGSAEWSRVGSRLAAETAVERLVALDAAGPPEHPAEDRDRLLQSALHARAVLEAEAERRFLTLADLHCTLLLALRRNDTLTALQIGDGIIAQIRDQEVQIPTRADEGAFGAETLFLTSAHIDRAELERRCHQVPVEDGAVLILASDGVSEDFFPPERELPRLLAADDIPGMFRPDMSYLPGLGYLHNAETPLKPDALADWLGYQRKGSSDDRTLLLGFPRKR